MLSLVTLLPGVYGLKEIARGEHFGPAAIGLVVAVVAGTVFVRRQRRLADPLVDLELFADRRFTIGLATFLVTGVVMAGVSFAAALYLQGVLGLSPTAVGAWLVPQSLVMLAGTLLAPRLDQRLRHRGAGGRRAGRRRWRAAAPRPPRHRLARPCTWSRWSSPPAASASRCRSSST